MSELTPPPKDEDSENAVLGSIIIEGSLIETVSCLCAGLRCITLSKQPRPQPPKEFF